MVISTVTEKSVVNSSVFLRSIMASSAGSKKKDKRTTLNDFDLSTTLGKRAKSNSFQEEPFAAFFAILRIALP